MHFKLRSADLVYMRDDRLPHGVFIDEGEKKCFFYRIRQIFTNMSICMVYLSLGYFYRLNTAKSYQIHTGTVQKKISTMADSDGTKISEIQRLPQVKLVNISKGWALLYSLSFPSSNVLSDT